MTTVKPWGDWSPLTHPARARIMLACAERPTSAKMAADAVGVSVSLQAYHFRKLREAGLIEVAETRQRRGAAETLYRLSPAGETALLGLAHEINELNRLLRGWERRQAA